MPNCEPITVLADVSATAGCLRIEPALRFKLSSPASEGWAALFRYEAQLDLYPKSLNPELLVVVGDSIYAPQDDVDKLRERFQRYARSASARYELFLQWADSMCEEIMLVNKPMMDASHVYYMSDEFMDPYRLSAAPAPLWGYLFGM